MDDSTNETLSFLHEYIPRLLRLSPEDSVRVLASTIVAMSGFYNDPKIFLECLENTLNLLLNDEKSISLMDDLRKKHSRN